MLKKIWYTKHQINALKCNRTNSQEHWLVKKKLTKVKKKFSKKGLKSLNAVKD